MVVFALISNAATSILEFANRTCRTAFCSLTTNRASPTVDSTVQRQATNTFHLIQKGTIVLPWQSVGSPLTTELELPLPESQLSSPSRLHRSQHQALPAQDFLDQAFQGSNQKQAWDEQG